MEILTKFKFILGEVWNGTLMFAQFAQDGRTYNQYKEVTYG